MIIRTAQRYDLDIIVDMMRDYSVYSPIPILRTQTNEIHVRTLLTHIIMGMGVIFLAEKDNVTCGMLICIRQNNIWNNNIYHISELAYWVDEKYRNSTAGYRLLKAYTDYCESRVKNKEIEYFTISKMNNSPDLRYDRYGFNKLEETWSK
jgi:Acetyltransferase (GNAT) domain